jgi:hypothetical protein
MADNNEDERPTESTPLIRRRSTVPTQHPSPSLPLLTPVVNRIRHHGIRTVDEEPFLIGLISHPASLSQQIAFEIIVLSQLYILAKAPSIGVRTDVWEQWSGERVASLDAENLQRRIERVWEEFLGASRTTQEIEECLWSPFALEEGKSVTVRGKFFICCTRRASDSYPFFPISVVDILKDHDAPPALVSHRLISLSLSHTWTCGRTLIPVGSLFGRILQRFHSVATPRCVEPTL